MPRSPNALSVKPMDRNGQPYQQRTFDVLPVLVRQATTGVPLTYGQIAKEVGINPRNLDKILGSIGVTLKLLSAEWNEDIPPIQSLAINTDTRIPGSGFDYWFPDPSVYQTAPMAQKRKVIEVLWRAVTAYPGWRRALSHLAIKPLPTLPLDTLLSQSARATFGTGGESEAHKDFKLFVSQNPPVVKIVHSVLKTETEYRFASADAVDLLFTTRPGQVAVEVKAKNAPAADVLRGIFQCVKYAALLKATHAVKGIVIGARVVLALEGPLPEELDGTAKMLEVEVIANIRP